jgi:hypothetical protein
MLHVNSLELIIANKIKKLEILYINESETGAYISDTLRLDETQTEIEARSIPKRRLSFIRPTLERS